MQIFSITVGQTIGIQAIPKAADNSVVTNTGNAVCVGGNDAVAMKTNNTGDGLTTNIQGVSAGSAIFTLTGHKPDMTEVSTQFSVSVSAPSAPVLDHFDFVQVPPI